MYVHCMYVVGCSIIVQKKNPDAQPEKKAAKVDLSPLFLPREPYMPNREAVSQHAKLIVHCTIILQQVYFRISLKGGKC